ncbi:hypothetical protein CYMTET_11047 [Cymbomonas tetramitiformis]|uniref:Uncharacterized protein n=1 Tax=Cymbomonas tetramitiformis TaxID=36881 RepID=A0AAE0LDJ7_9CHLO|nr:hypothetical protein CYMTET_11047 [Cymbomonas tetramitiformis]
MANALWYDSTLALKRQFRSALAAPRRKAGTNFTPGTIARLAERRRRRGRLRRTGQPVADCTPEVLHTLALCQASISQPASTVAAASAAIDTSSYCLVASTEEFGPGGIDMRPPPKEPRTELRWVLTAWGLIQLMRERR